MKLSFLKQGIRLFVLTSFIACAGHAVSQDDELSVEDETDRLKNIDKRGSDLFAIATPGETYSELTGEIGHSATDISLQTNGLLSFDVKRESKLRPAEYPYALGTMDLNIPYITFTAPRLASTSGVVVPLMTCSQFEGLGGHVFNDIKLEHLSGSVSLIHKQQVEAAVRNRYPVSNNAEDAEYISTDHWLLDCWGNEYRAKSPDGTVYYFNASTGGETVERDREYQNNIGIPYGATEEFALHKIYVDRIQRNGAELKFVHQTALNTNYAGREYSQHNYKVRPPMHYEAVATRDSTGSIYHKRRLASIESTVVAESVANGAPVEKQSLYFSYNLPTDMCPGLLKSVHSATTKIAKVIYGYDLVEQEVKDRSAPHSQCVLKTVSYAPENSNDHTLAWSFTYGAVGTGSSYYFPASGIRDDWTDYYSKPVSTLPLRSVTTLTGATTTYEYQPGYTCDHHDSALKRKDLWNPISKCARSEDVAIPMVKKRTVSGWGVATQNTTIEYKRIDEAYRIERTIKDETRTQRLVFGRTNHSIIPNGALLGQSPQAYGTYLNSSKLLVYELLDTQNQNKPALVTIVNTYAEGDVFPTEFLRGITESEKAPTSNIDLNYASWHKSRYMYMFDNRRINLINKVIEIDGIEYETQYSNFDAFNNPKTITEIYNPTSGSAEQRVTSLTYDNDYAAKNIYFVGGVKSKITTSGSAFPLVERFVYNANGLIDNKTVAGFKTSYSYHSTGNIYQVIDGRGKDERRYDYKRGIPRKVTDRNGMLTQTEVDDKGVVTKTIDPEGIQMTYTPSQTDYANRIDRIDRNAQGSNYYKDTEIFNAQFDKPNDAQYREHTEIIRGKKRKATRYDSLGRVISILEQDYTGTGENRVRRFKYDRQGRLILKGDPKTNWTTSHGTHYKYDNYGRVDSISYPLIGSPAIEYCYGSACNSQSNFNKAGTIKDGYAIRDQLGYVTVHNYRAFGAPDNAELIEIRQEIRPNTFSTTDDRTNDSVVVTEINRNQIGFITSIVQEGDDGSTSFERTYFPYATAGSTTHLVKRETHPEFGTKTVDQFDANGNAIKVTNFNGAQTTYTYDQMDRLRYSLNPGSSGGTAGVPNRQLQYYDNGTLKAVFHGNRRWEYNYNEINLLDSETLTIDNETFRIGYEYNTYAQIKDVVYPSDRIVHYENSGHDQQKSVDGFVTDASYHPNGLISEIQFENGTRFSSTIDDFQRPDIWRTEDSNAAAYFHFRYLYDTRGNVTGINNYFPPNGGSLTGLQYDGLNRLVRADANDLWGTAKFSYDPIGNIIKQHVGGVNREYEYGDQTNLLESVEVGGMPLLDLNLSYDDNGNVTSTGVADYQFDQLNRLVRSDDGTAILENTYDGHNMRVKGRTIRDGQISTTYYVYNRAGQLLHELDSETGETRDHIQLNGRTIATVGSHNFVDTDNDGMPDYFERQHGLNASVNDAMLDDDKDGRSNLVEYLYGHLPNDADTDNDGIPDGQDSELPPFMPMFEQVGGVDLTPIYEYLLE